MPRHTPDEGAVRGALRDAERAAGSGQQAADENGVEQPAEETTPPAVVDAEEDGSTDEDSGADAPETDETDQTAEPSEAERYLDLARRTQADFENYRKRAAKDIAAAGARARAGLIRELLPVVDNLERALDTAPEGDPMAEGVRLVLMDVRGVLSRAGVEPLEPQGEPFDPNVHEALTTRQEEGVESGVVLDVVEKGYRSAEQVIRPARVIVAA